MLAQLTQQSSCSAAIKLFYKLLEGKKVIISLKYTKKDTWTTSNSQEEQNDEDYNNLLDNQHALDHAKSFYRYIL